MPRPMLSSDTMDLLKESYKITFDRLCEEGLLSKCTGAIQELERHTGRLKKLENLLILKDQLQSGGMATEKKKMLSLMNSQDSSELNICSDGWTSTQLLSKSKAVLVPCSPPSSGSLPTSPLTTGITIQTQLKNKGKRLRED